MNKRHAFYLLIGALALPGCGIKGCSQDTTSGIAAADLPAPTWGQATVSGHVQFEGEVPEMPVIAAAQTCSPGLREEWARVSDDGGLANVLVYLDEVPGSTGSAHAPAVLDQVDCRFVPHVLGVQVGQAVDIESSDAVLHNVRYTPDLNTDTNFALTGANQRRRVSFDYPEADPVRVKCDIHPWMTAWIGVFDHPFFAVTDEAGQFNIERVPAGSYTLRAWHERYGSRQQAIEVADAGELVADFTFGRSGG